MENERIYKFMTPVDVWADFDPESEPLETERIRTQTIGDITYESIYFTAKSIGEKKLRVYAKTARCAKARGAKPALLVATPCLGKELDLSQFKRLMEEGYVLVTFDYEGKTQEKLRYTLYPEELSYCNKKDAGDHMYHAEPSAHETTWYNWVVIARRTISLLSELEYVDSEKVVMIGEGEGCPITWQTVAMDKRLKGACTIFGYDLKYLDGDPEERDCWLSGVDMRSYASYVNVPFLHVGVTNSTDNSFDSLLKIVENMKEKTEFYTDFAFGYDYGLSERQYKALTTFLDKVFNEENFATIPTLDVTANEDGEFVAKITCEGAKHAEVWYAYGSEPEKRVWKKQDCVKKNGVYTAKIDLSVSDDILRIFGRVSYGKYSVCSCSKVAVPTTIGVKCLERRRTKILFDSALEGSELLPVSEKHVLPENAVELRDGAVGLKGVTTELEGLAYLKDPEVVIDFKTAESLQFEFYGVEARTLTVKLYTVNKTYTTVKELIGADAWQRVLLPTSVFKDEAFKKMLSWDGLWKIEIMGVNGALINKILII